MMATETVERHRAIGRSGQTKIDFGKAQPCWIGDQHRIDLPPRQKGARTILASGL